MKPIRKTRHALMFMGAGAVAAYFLDPEAGPERRERLLEQVQSLTGQMGSGSGSGDSEEQSGSSTSSSAPSSTSSGSAAEPFAGSPGPSGSADDASSDDSASGPIDLATGEPLSSSSTSPSA